MKSCMRGRAKNIKSVQHKLWKCGITPNAKKGSAPLMLANTAVASDPGASKGVHSVPSAPSEFEIIEDDIVAKVVTDLREGGH